MALENEVNKIIEENAEVETQVETQVEDTDVVSENVETKDEPLVSEEDLKVDTELLNTEFAKLVKEDDDIEFTDKVKEIFEAVVINKVKELAKKIEEKLQDKFDKKFELVKEEYATSSEEKIDGYMSLMAENFIIDNKPAIDSGIRTELAEEFMQKLHKVFKESYAEVPEDKRDVYEELVQEKEKLQNKLNEQMQTNVNQMKENNKLKRKAVLASFAEGLTDTEFEKLTKLAEDIEFNEETFSDKIKDLKESVFAKGKTDAQTIAESVVSNEPVSISEEEVVAQPEQEQLDEATILANKLKLKR